MPKQTIRDIALDGRKVLIRVDFNVPQGRGGSISDDRRIRAALPTLEFALGAGASLILVSHLGRPTGDPAGDAPFRLDAIAARLGELLGSPVLKVGDTVGPEAQEAAAKLRPGEVLVLENVRFDPGEKKGDPAFAKALAGLADAYVNDAFGTCHRDEASMVAVPEQFPPADRAIGFLVEKELQILDTLLKHPKSPMVAVMGGSKVSDKIGVIENLLPRIDKLLVGGAMTYTFLKAQGTRPARAGSKGTSSTRPVACSNSPVRSWSSRPITWSPSRSTLRARPRLSPAPRSPKAASASTSARKRSPSTPGSSSRPAPWSGTARWGSSKTSRSARGRSASPRRWPPRRE